MPSRIAPMQKTLAFTLLVCAHTVPRLALAETFEVGDDKPLATLGEVPWEALVPGDEVRIHYRAQPYHEKLVLAVSGSQAAPIRIVGVRGPAGQRPVLDGDDARTRAALDYWGEERGIIKIGGASRPSSPRGAYLEIEGLEIRGARSTNSFTSHDGTGGVYADNAAAIFVERGEHIVLRDCALHDSGNGLFVANQSVDIRIERCEIEGNGNVDSNFEHNVYSEALGIVFEGNRLGPLCNGCRGNNLKDRSAGTVIRFNWIMGGNRQLDLVESGSDTLRNDARYANTYVYGNVLIEDDDAGNRQIVHWGGDNGNTSTYRKGVLHMYANTIVSRRPGRTTLLRNSSPNGRAELTSNIVQCGNGVGQLEILGDALGRATLRNNWLPLGFVASFDAPAMIDTDASNVVGGEPGFMAAANGDYRLAASSLCLNAGAFPELGSDYTVTGQVPEPRALEGRPNDGEPDIGALERGMALPWDGGSDAGTEPGASDAGGDGGSGGGGSKPGGGGVHGPDDGVQPGNGEPGASPARSDGGCSCSAAGDSSWAAGWPLLMALGLVWRAGRAAHASGPKKLD